MANVEVSDGVLHERVRARIGSVIGHAGAIDAAVIEGQVSLRGPVLTGDVDRLVRRVRSVPGVREVINQLDVHDEPGGVPGLQGRARPPRGGEVFELLQTHWSPTARLFASLSGAAMVLWGWRRLDLPGILLTAGGVVVLLRGVRNEPLTSLEARGRG
jgi:hypothetical protein